MKLFENVYFVFFGVILALSVTACDKGKFQKEHPNEAIVIEDVMEFMQKIAENEAEHILHLPDGSLHIVFDNKLFIIPAKTVEAATNIGSVIPEDISQ